MSKPFVSGVALAITIQPGTSFVELCNEETGRFSTFKNDRSYSYAVKKMPTYTLELSLVGDNPERMFISIIQPKNVKAVHDALDEAVKDLKDYGLYE